MLLPFPMQKYEENDKQNAAEFVQFIELIKQHGVSSYLEIGSKDGGSLWAVAQALPKGARIVSADLPHKRTNEENLRACVRELSRQGFDVRLFLGDSTEPDIIEMVRKLGPFDLVFIDANHREPFVWKDWANYGPLGRIVAFHDIAYERQHRTGRAPIDVPVVWQELKKQFKHVEISREAADNGIGVLFRDDDKA